MKFHVWHVSRWCQSLCTAGRTPSTRRRCYKPTWSWKPRFSLSPSTQEPPVTRSHLLPCTCGRKVSIEVGQAGGTVVCECGVQLDVPTMRQIRELEPAPSEESPSHVRTDDWNARKGVILLGLVIAVLSAGLGAYFLTTKPKLPTYHLETAIDGLRKEIDAYSPADTWYVWKVLILKNGLTEIPKMSHHVVIEVRAVRQQYVVIALVAAGCGLAISIVGLLWKPRPRRALR